MSADRSHSPPSVTSSTQYRRASLTPGAFTERFPKHNGSGSANLSHQAGSPPFPGSLTTAAASAQSNQRRRPSITTLGLSGSPTQSSPFGNRTMRRESLSSSVESNSATFEDAVDDSENTSLNNQAVPFARRVSFGAQALREVRGGGGTGNGRYSSGSSSMPPRRHTASSTVPSFSERSSSASSLLSAATSTSKYSFKNDGSNLSWRLLGEGFNWSEALRTRAERAPSISSMFSTSSQGPQSSITRPQAHHQRAASIAIMEQPAREMPREPRQNKPDFFQEKILRADFMD